MWIKYLLSLIQHDVFENIHAFIFLHDLLNFTLFGLVCIRINLDLLYDSIFLNFDDLLFNFNFFHPLRDLFCLLIIKLAISGYFGVHINNQLQYSLLTSLERFEYIFMVN